MEDKNKERLYHENVQNESAFAKRLAKALSGGKENMTLEKGIMEEIIKTLESLFQESPEK